MEFQDPRLYTTLQWEQQQQLLRHSQQNPLLFNNPAAYGFQPPPPPAVFDPRFGVPGRPLPQPIFGYIPQPFGKSRLLDELTLLEQDIALQNPYAPSAPPLRIASQLPIGSMIDPALGLAPPPPSLPHEFGDFPSSRHHHHHHQHRSRHHRREDSESEEEHGILKKLKKMERNLLFLREEIENTKEYVRNQRQQRNPRYNTFYREHTEDQRPRPMDDLRVRDDPSKYSDENQAGVKRPRHKTVDPNKRSPELADLDDILRREDERRKRRNLHESLSPERGEFQNRAPPPQFGERGRRGDQERNVSFKEDGEFRGGSLERERATPGYSHKLQDIGHWHHQNE